MLCCRAQGVDVLVRDKESLCAADVQWADLILAAGGWLVVDADNTQLHQSFVAAAGDGNFLRTASKVLNQSKLLVGINTDPTR